MVLRSPWLEKEAVMLYWLNWLGSAAEKPRPCSRRPRPLRLELEQLEDRRLLSAASVVDPAGHTDVFFRGADQQVYEQQFDASGNVVHGPTLTAPGQVQDVSAVRLQNGNSLLLVRGLDDRVWAQPFDGNGNSTGGYSLMAGGQVKGLEPVVTITGTPLVFVTGLDDQVWQLKLNATGQATGDYTLPASGAVLSLIVSSIGPAYPRIGPASPSQGGPVLLARGLDQQVYEQQYDTSGNLVSGFHLVAPGAVKEISYSFGQFFAIGLNDQVYSLQLGTSNEVGGYVLTQPGQVQAISQAIYEINPPPGNTNPSSFAPELFVIGMDGQVYGQKFDSTGKLLGNYSLTTPGTVNGIIAWTSSGLPRPIVLALGTDDRLYEQTFDNNGNSTGGYQATGSGQVLW
jgi:hypothetical protein